jgi:hypothetical protein
MQDKKFKLTTKLDVETTVSSNVFEKYIIKVFEIQINLFFLSIV